MTTKGPSGFIELNGQLLVVDFGKIFLDGAIVGLIFDDGYLQHTSGPFGTNKNLRPVDAIPGCVFRGIDSGGLELILPQCGEANKLIGPTGSLKFNSVPFHVINGRIAAPDHGFIGEFDDDRNRSERALVGHGFGEGRGSGEDEQQHCGSVAHGRKKLRDCLVAALIVPRA